VLSWIFGAATSCGAHPTARRRPLELLYTPATLVMDSVAVEIPELERSLCILTMGFSVEKAAPALAPAVAPPPYIDTHKIRH
jgi:hypothetical protein